MRSRIVVLGFLSSLLTVLTVLAKRTIRGERATRIESLGPRRVGAEDPEAA